MTVLAVDTSSGQGSLALARADKLAEVVELPPEWKSTTLHGAIGGLLERHGLAIREISGYAVASGPGPFTGLRIGLTAVKGLAEAHGKPVITISTLELLAIAAQRQLGPTFAGPVAPLLDARRGQVFGALFLLEGETIHPVVQECVCALPLLLERIRASGQAAVRFCGTQLEPFAHEIIEAGWEASSFVSVPPLLAGVLAQLAVGRLQKGQGAPAAQAEANYIRPSDAELFWKG